MRIKTAIRSDYGLLTIFALAKLLLHLLTNAFGGYGIFRDELYYLACANHPAAGYVDEPPLSILLLAVHRMLFGDSLFALRALPAIAGAVTVFMTGLIARQMGGARWAQALAAAGSALATINLGMQSYYSMNAFDILIWTLGFWVLNRLVLEPSPRLWVLLGALLGIGLLNKISVLWLGAGIVAGLVLTDQRRWLATPWPSLAAGLALLLFLPFVLWNVSHDFAHLEFIRNATQTKYSGQTTFTFVTGQFLLMNPVMAPLWLTGLAALLMAKRFRGFRIPGIVFLVTMLILMLNGHSKPEYLAAAYAPLFAAGGMIWESWGARQQWRIVRPAFLTLLLAGGLALAPFALPMLPVETYIRYAASLGVTPSTTEKKELGRLPQHYADMFGWAEKVEAVANVFRGLSPDEQARCAILANNYGRAAAIDYFGRKYGLPRAIGTHNNYWLWGPRDYTGEIMIIIGWNTDDLRKRFATVEIPARVTTGYAMPYENDLPIHLCRGARRPLQDVWGALKHYE